MENEVKISKFSNFCLVILASVYGTNTYANTDIKLNCILTISMNHSSGTTERNTKNVIVEILQTSSHLSILPNDSDVAAVSTRKLSSTDTVNNLSDSNRWDLTNIRTREGRVTEVTIQIDRNTGLMKAYQNFNQGRIIVDASGNCEKVDTSKKKF